MREENGKNKHDFSRKLSIYLAIVSEVFGEPALLGILLIFELIEEESESSRGLPDDLLLLEPHGIADALRGKVSRVEDKVGVTMPVRRVGE